MHGLVPRNAPIFVEEFLDEYDWEKCAKKTVNSDRYMDLLEEKFAPAAREVFQRKPITFQDDEATIHRTKKALKKVSELFENRIEIDDQAPKLDDVWPIENVWGILAEKLRFRKFKTLKGLRTAICQIWRDFDVDACKRLVHSIPFRLKDVIEREGHRIGKFDSERLSDETYKK